MDISESKNIPFLSSQSSVLAHRHTVLNERPRIRRWRPRRGRAACALAVMSCARMSRYQGSEEQHVGSRSSQCLELAHSRLRRNKCFCGSARLSSPPSPHRPHLLEAALAQKVVLDRESSQVPGNASNYRYRYHIGKG